MPRIAPLTQKQAILNAQIKESGARINEIISHLLDITKARFGSGLPVLRSHMDMGCVARQLVDEMRTMHPDREFVLGVSGETEGDWDKARIGQVFSNLLGNAVQYSFRDTPINLTLKGRSDDVVLVVHNDGIPIQKDKIPRIFDSLTRATADDEEYTGQGVTNLGLGLYITKEIVTAHGGSLDVASSEKDGTTFTAYFPRKADAGQDEDPIPDLSPRTENLRDGDSEKRIH